MPEFVRRRLGPARRLEWYPPFRALRVRVVELSDDWRRVRLLLPLAANRNPGGSMFGGAMACLADPVAALACARVFPGHQVWTRELTLDFRRESRSDMELRFLFDPRVEAEVREALTRRGRATPAFEYFFHDNRERPCVRVGCRVAIRPIDYRPPTRDQQEQASA
jgi:acyl-coenzyme A thioesterase PaaI-like protein